MPGLIVFSLLAIAGITLLLDDVPGNDAFGWAFFGAGIFGALVSGLFVWGAA